MGVSEPVGMLVVSVHEMVSTAAEATTEPAAKMRIRSSMRWVRVGCVRQAAYGYFPLDVEVPPSYDV